eukprot:7598302-Pyramimonas_sp.AAC.1
MSSAGTAPVHTTPLLLPKQRAMNARAQTDGARGHPTALNAFADDARVEGVAGDPGANARPAIDSGRGR